jgi:DNA-binding CsgD family transcriptional regulator
MIFSTPQDLYFSEILNLKERLRATTEKSSSFNGKTVTGLFAPQSHFTYPYTGYAICFRTLSYLYAGSTVESLTGYTYNDFIQNGVSLVSQAIHPDDRDIVGKCFAHLLYLLRDTEKERIPQMQFSQNWRFMRKDGRYVSILQQFVIPEVDEDHNPVLQYGIMTDITAYSKAESPSLCVTHPNGLTEIIRFPDTNQPVISSREKDVLNLICQGLSTKRIAEKLFISENTVKNHRANIMIKTKSRNVADLTRYALMNEIA